ncbi:PREDICTED: uncharacterized protein LOC106807683 isoform X3 [Priapulus caudatus]|uniref:Uncharacterized protein LOC106807683 isoform X3 n=1 Tax=Priapulus caudatus TaxID=37621 RepID=A0ABM1E072_PRICU|nr:PREDICTED: uncharacterized protein LOC106807683 isoform X3 [Priapulus caudatus]
MEAPTVRNTAEVMLQVCEALIYIHEQQLVHCAVSSNSIHLVTPYAAKLANFEYMVPRGNTSGAHTNMHECAVYNWLAPELMNAEPATEMADVYSFCSVLWEMLNGMMPWPERSASEIKQVITKQGKTLPLSNNKVPQLLHDVLERGLQLASYDRSVSFDDLRELLLVSLRSSNSRKSSKFSLKPLNDTLGGSYERKISRSKLVSPLTNTSYSGRFQEMNENQLQEASLQKPPSPARNMSTRRIAIRKLMTGRTGLTSGEDSDDDKSMDDVNTQGPTYSGGKQYGTPATLDSSMKSTHDSSFSEDAPSDTVYNTKWGPKAEYRHEESGAACYPAGHSRERPLVDPKLIGIVSSHRGYKSISPVKYGTAPQNGSAPGDGPKSMGSNRERWNRSNSLQDDPVMHRPPAGHAKQGSYGSRRSSAGYGQNTSFASYSSRGSVGSLAIPNYCVGMKPAGHGCEVSVGSKQSTHHTSYSRLPDDIRDAVMYKAPHIDASYSELPENPTREAIKEKWFGGKGSVRNLISAYHDIEKEEIEASQKSYTYLRSHLSQSSMNSQRLDSDLPDTQLKTLYSAAGVDSNRPAPEVSTQQMASRSDGSGSTDLDCSAVSVEAHQGSPAIQQQPSDTSSSGTDNAKPSSESAEDPQSFLDYAKAMRDQVTAEIRDSFSNLKLKPVGERTNGSQPTSSSDSSRGKQLEVTFSEYVMEREHSDNLPTSADSSVNTEGFPASVEREDYGDEIMSNGMSGAEARIRPTCPDGYPEFQQQNGIDADLNNLISPRNLPTHDIYLDDEYGEKTLDLSMEQPPAYDDMDENDMDENDLEDIINAGSCLEKADEERMETTANKVFEIERGNEYTVRIEASGDDDKQHVTHTMKNLKTGESKTVLAHTVNAPGSFEQCVVINSGAS